MKTKFFYFLLAISLVLAACEPKNQPVIDDGEKLEDFIQLSISSLRQSPSVFVEEAQKIGYKFTKAETPEGEFESYNYINKNCTILVRVNNDKVFEIYYDYSFVNTYINGVNKYIEASNNLANYDWTQWRTTFPEEYEDIYDWNRYDEYISRVKEYFVDFYDSQADLIQDFQMPFDTNHYLWVNLCYLGWVDNYKPNQSNDHPVTNQIVMTFTIRNEPVNFFQ